MQTDHFGIALPQDMELADRRVEVLAPDHGKFDRVLWEQNNDFKSSLYSVLELSVDQMTFPNLMISRKCLCLCCILWPLSCMFYLVKKNLILLALLIFFLEIACGGRTVQHRHEDQLQFP